MTTQLSVPTTFFHHTIYIYYIALLWGDILLPPPCLTT